MKKLSRLTDIKDINKCLEDFKKEHPYNKDLKSSQRWDDLGELKKNIKLELLINQHNLCGYCEARITVLNLQIVHFIPKSLSTEDHDYAFDINNFILSCNGDEKDPKNKDRTLTCGPKKGNLDPRSRCLNPYELPKFSIFQLKLEGDLLFLIPDKNACEKANIIIDLVLDTINILELNCTRLARVRYNIYTSIRKQVNDSNFFYDSKSIVDYLLTYPEYFTTVLLTLFDRIDDIQLLDI
jgi:uncharacterized protein (TIGR02646 family)